MSKRNLRNDLAVIRDYVLNGSNLELVCDKMVKFIHKNINPEDVYVYTLIQMANYHQLLAGYAYHVISFHDNNLTPMQNHHRWNRALKNIEDQNNRLNYYKIVTDHFENVNKMDVMNGYRNLLMALIKLHLLTPMEQNKFDIEIPIRHRKPIQTANLDLNLIALPTLNTQCLVKQ